MQTQTINEMDKLVQRLRAIDVVNYSTSVCSKAADEIERLQDERDKLKEQLEKASNYIQEAKAAVPGIVSGEVLSEAITRYVECVD